MNSPVTLPPSFSTVAAFYQGKSVFLTGATGFVGKVLLVRLLSACPQVERIYLLMRRGARNGKSADSRLADLLQSRAFTFTSSPLPIDKVVAIEGDISQPRLGLSAGDRQLLVEQVSVVFHAAANVKFEGPLKEFVVANVLGTEAILQLAQKMRQLKAIVYVSTAFSNCHLLDIEEKVYPLERPVQSMIERILAENSDLTPKRGDAVLEGRANAYTLSKAMGENLVAGQYGHLPVVISRPSVVISSQRDPAAGWCDSLNGFAGLLLLTALGILRTLQINGRCKPSVIPVDFLANSLIVTGWHTATYPEERQLVVNLTLEDTITSRELFTLAPPIVHGAPSLKLVRPMARNIIRDPNFLGKTNHQLTKFFSQTLFAYLVDGVLLLTGNKPILVKITQKMHRAMESAAYFNAHEWHFQVDNYRRIQERLSPEERSTFQCEGRLTDWLAYLGTAYLGYRRYLLKEDDSTIEVAFRRQKRLIFVYRSLEVALYLALIALLAFIGYAYLFKAKLGSLRGEADLL